MWFCATCGECTLIAELARFASGIRQDHALTVADVLAGLVLCCL